METVKYEMAVPKEGKELVDAVMVLLKHFKGGGDVSSAMVHLGLVATAVEGAAGVVDELKSEYNDELAGYLVHMLWDALKS
jgi:hypothetical protein